MELREPSDEELSELRERIRPYLSDERYAHTLSVEGECAYMAKILMPEHERSLRAAALLHDIAKKQTYEKQLNYIRECDILEMEKGKTRIIPAVAHAPAGAAMVIMHFSEYACDDIVSAVRYHTTGHDGLTMFEAIVFLADYIEPTRKYAECRELHDFVHENLSCGGERILRRALIRCIENTLAHIEGEPDDDTVKTLNYLQSGGKMPRTL